MTIIPIELTRLAPQKSFMYGDIHVLPEAQGIYGIIDESLGLQYLGITQNLKLRFTNPNTGFFDHHYFSRETAPTPFGLSDHFPFETYLTFWNIDDSWQNIKTLEKALIRKYHPRGNKRHNPFSSAKFWSIHNTIDSIGKDSNYSLQWENKYWNPFHHIYMTESKKMWRHSIKKYLNHSWLYDYTPFDSFVKGVL